MHTNMRQWAVGNLSALVFLYAIFVVTEVRAQKPIAVVLAPPHVIPAIKEALQPPTTNSTTSSAAATPKTGLREWLASYDVQVVEGVKLPQSATPPALILDATLKVLKMDVRRTSTVATPVLRRGLIGSGAGEIVATGTPQRVHNIYSTVRVSLRLVDPSSRALIVATVDNTGADSQDILKSANENDFDSIVSACEGALPKCESQFHMLLWNSIVKKQTVRATRTDWEIEFQLKNPLPYGLKCDLEVGGVNGGVLPRGIAISDPARTVDLPAKATQTLVWTVPQAGVKPSERSAVLGVLRTQCGLRLAKFEFAP